MGKSKYGKIYFHFTRSYAEGILNSSLLALTKGVIKFDTLSLCITQKDNLYMSFSLSKSFSEQNIPVGGQ